MSGAIDDFAKRYAAQSDISLSNLSSAVLNKNRGVSKGRSNRYGSDIPVGISNTDFIYAFVDVVSLMPSVVKHRSMTNKLSALFVLYTLQHQPFFNLQTDFFNIKTSKLCPALSHKNGQTSVIPAAGPLVHFSTASLDTADVLIIKVGHRRVVQRTSPLNNPKGFRKIRVKVSVS